MSLPSPGKASFVVDISYTLHAANGEMLSEETQSPVVPRIGELVCFDRDPSYQVVDVLWHHSRAGGTRATVTACELNWHKHVVEVTEAWHEDHR
ncbi:hypothetical protein ILP97_23615 [Amycolatopsis sp. H6(2020)]|nr:hypothetical protein [Amycolatopsis sp. H6(2020)]